MALVKICKLLILRSSDRHFRPILAPKSRFSATCLAPDRQPQRLKPAFRWLSVGTAEAVP